MSRREAHVKNDVLDCLGSDPDFMGWNSPCGKFFTKEGDVVKVGVRGMFDTTWGYRLRITEDMVGGQIAVAVGVETKHPDPKIGQQDPHQINFQRAWEMRNGVYILTRTHIGIKDRIHDRVLQTIQESKLQ